MDNNSNSSKKRKVDKKKDKPQLGALVWVKMSEKSGCHQPARLVLDSNKQTIIRQKPRAQDPESAPIMKVMGNSSLMMVDAGSADSGDGRSQQEYVLVEWLSNQTQDYVSRVAIEDLPDIRRRDKGVLKFREEEDRRIKMLSSTALMPLQGRARDDAGTKEAAGTPLGSQSSLRRWYNTTTITSTTNHHDNKKTRSPLWNGEGKGVDDVKVGHSEPTVTGRRPVIGRITTPPPLEAAMPLWPSDDDDNNNPQQEVHCIHRQYSNSNQAYSLLVTQKKDVVKQQQVKKSLKQGNKKAKMVYKEYGSSSSSDHDDGDDAFEYGDDQEEDDYCSWDDEVDAPTRKPSRGNRQGSSTLTGRPTRNSSRQQVRNTRIIDHYYDDKGCHDEPPPRKKRISTAGKQNLTLLPEPEITERNSAILEGNVYSESTTNQQRPRLIAKKSVSLQQRPRIVARKSIHVAVASPLPQLLNVMIAKSPASLPLAKTQAKDTESYHAHRRSGSSVPNHSKPEGSQLKTRNVQSTASSSKKKSIPDRRRKELNDEEADDKQLWWLGPTIKPDWPEGAKVYVPEFGHAVYDVRGSSFFFHEKYKHIPSLYQLSGLGVYPSEYVEAGQINTNFRYIQE